MFCSQCGQENSDNSIKCISCDYDLSGSQRPQNAAKNDGTLGGLIPYKNAQALWAYYLGIFSLIPCLGIPLGIAAFVMGIRGLKQAKLRPEIKGQAHAWIGIILGGLCAVGYTLLVLTPFILSAFNY